MSGVIAAQTSTPAAANSSDDSKIANQIQALREAMAQQQQQIDKLQQQLAERNKAAATPQVVNASITNAAAFDPVVSQSDAEKQKESPLSFRIGNAEFTPGGFLDFTAIFRTTNVGSLGTNFFAIPFSNNPTGQGQVTETRFTAQNSRVNVKVADKFGKNDVTGFFEMDFLGNDAANVFVTSNSHTMRLRHYFVDYKRNKWEILGGQTWSWLTPNRVGLSPYSADVFYSQDMDFNYQVGLTWTRAPQFRVAYHLSKNLAFGVALENPQQFIGQANEVVLPAGLNAALATQLDGANNSNTPNVHPDIIPKIAYDTDIAGKHFHVEAVGLFTSAKVAIPVATATVPPGTAFVKQTQSGGGGSVNVNLEVVKNLRVIGNSFFSDGGGRYIFGMGPQLVVRPDGTISMVHSGSGIGGLEYQVTPHTLLYGYYGGAYFQRNFFPDPTNAKAGSFAGFGFPGSNLAANRSIQEGTIGWTQTFWRNPQFGALQLLTQASYVTRSPWSVPVNAPKNAHLTMGWADLRFTLP